MGSAVLLTYERHRFRRNLSRDSPMTVNTAMKKEQKVSKGYALDVAPPDLSLPGGVAESDDRPPRPTAQSSFGTSANAPSETASEDSCSLKRKSMSLNGDSFRDSLSAVVGLYDLSLRDLTSVERRGLRKRLKLQLQVILSLVGKLEARELQLKGSSESGVVQASQVDVYVPAVNRTGAELEPARFAQAEARFFQGTLGTGGKEKRTPKVNQLYVNSEFVSGTDKTLLSEKLKSKPAAGLKRNLQEKMNTQDPKRHKVDTACNRKMSEFTRQCGIILQNLMSHKNGWVFNEPVDVVKLGLRDYFTIIEKPMDLGTIKAKLQGDKYSSPLEFAEDVRLTFDNAMRYNPPGHSVHRMANGLKKLFENQWKPLGEKVKELQVEMDDNKMHTFKGLQSSKAFQVEAAKPRRKLVADSSHPHTIGTINQKSRLAVPSNTSVTKAHVVPCRTMTFREKRELSQSLESLPNDKLEQILLIIKSRVPNLKLIDDEIEVDIDSFDPETLWELHRFVNNCSKEMSRKDGQKVLVDEANAGQPLNGGVSVTCAPIPARIGGEIRGEEFDIGGSDVPANNYTPVVIEKEAMGAGKYSNSSSSISGSSSSDSDSGSSPGNEADADNVQFTDMTKVPPGKEPAGSGAVCDQRGSPALETDAAKQSMTNILEDNISSKVAMLDAGVGQGGEGGTTEGQVSPEKLLRAARLKSRFADTILKAQEKTLPLIKSDKSDPEKLRKDREELERRQREERARLQAEAKAAELARKKAEAHAVAEARRKREEEREAARLALQKMQKTVEIDENSEILKDLEMLRTVYPEHIQIPSSGEDTSPVHATEGLPAFALQGGNPLEQLGLFMKIDDEEEEEHEKESVQQQKGNVSEGGAGYEDEEGEIED